MDLIGSRCRELLRDVRDTGRTGLLDDEANLPRARLHAAVGGVMSEIQVHGLQSGPIQDLVRLAEKLLACRLACREVIEELLEIRKRKVGILGQRPAEVVDVDGSGIPEAEGFP